MALLARWEMSDLSPQSGAKADTSQLANYSARPTPSCQGSVTALPSARRLLGRVLINAQIAVPAFFLKCPQRPSSMVYTVEVHLQRTLADLMFPPHVKAGEGEMNSLWFWEV
jgi:hypothetical protein